MAEPEVAKVCVAPVKPFKEVMPEAAVEEAQDIRSPPVPVELAVKISPGLPTVRVVQPPFAEEEAIIMFPVVLDKLANTPMVEVLFVSALLRLLSEVFTFVRNAPSVLEALVRRRDAPSFSSTIWLLKPITPTT